MDDRLEQPELDDLWDFDDPVGSAARFERAAGEHHSEIVRAELETQRARALGLQRRFAEADALLDLLEPAMGRLAVRILLERGRLRNTAGSVEEAIELFEEAFLAARREGETFLAVDAAHMLAIADRSHAEQWTDEAFAELRTTSDERTLRWAVALHMNLGWKLFDDSDADAALREFESALEAAVDHGTEDQRFLAEWTIARCLRELGRDEQALAIQRRLADERPDDEFVAGELAALTEPTPTIEP
jgi:tetratricopeptide (TPR) repeat protein